MANIFISHSSKDNDSALVILGSLQKVGSSIFLDFDSKHGLKGGQKWEKELYVRVKKSRIMIVVLSPNWLDSTWCYKEYCMARVLRKKIIPVIIEEDERIEKWDGNDIQHYNTIVDIDAIEKLKERVEKLTHSDVAKLYDIEKLDSPFPGLRSFNKDEAGIFYGRNEDILNSVDMLNGMIDGNEKFLNIIGASGVGKSSFLKAGILPFVELLHTNLWYILPIFRAKQELLLNLAKVLASALNRKSSEVLSMLRESEFIELFEEIELNAFDRAKEKNKDIENIKILFPIDQAEELLSVSNKKERDLFINILKFLLEKKSNFYLVWTLRADYLKKYQDEKSLEFVHQLETTLLLKPISSKKIKNIIQEPAFSADILIDDAVAEEIKENISSTLSLPILAYLLQTLFRTAKNENRKRITLNDYNALSKDEKNPIENIINESANAIYDKTEDIKSIKDLFLTYLVKVNIDESITKQSEKLDNIPANKHYIIEQFVNKRLFVKDRDEEGCVTIEIAHEALIYTWEKLIGWIEAEREFLVFKSHLNLYYNEWINANRNDKALLSGLSLEKAINFKDKLKNKGEIEFINKSIIHSEEQEKKFEDLYNIAQEEVEKAKHNIGLALLEKAKSALIEKKLLQANLFSFASLKNLSDKYDSTRAKISAENMIVSNPLPKLIFSIDVDSVINANIKYTINGKNIISASMDKTIKIWDAKSAELIKTFKGHESDVVCISCSPNGKNIISGSLDKTVRLWNIKSGELLYVFEGHKEGVINVAYSPNGKYIASLSSDGIINIWNIYNNKLMHTLEGNQAKLISLACSPNGKNIISGSLDSTIKIWNSKNGNLIDVLEQHDSWVKYLDYSPDGKYIVSGSDDKTIKIWDAKSAELIETFKGHESEVVCIAYSPNGKYIISGSLDKTVRLWDIKSGETLYVFEGQQEGICSVAYSPNGRYILSLTMDGVMNKYRLPMNTLKEHKKGVSCIACSPDGKSILSGSHDKTIKLYDAKSTKLIKTFKGHEREIVSVAYSPDGKNIISGSIDTTVRLWDLKSAELLHKIDGNNMEIKHVTYSPDGKEIMILFFEGDLHIWNVTGKIPIKIFEYKNSAVVCAMYLSESNTIVMGMSCGTVRTWNVKDNKLLKDLHEDDYSVMHVACSSDGENIIAYLDDFTIRLWDIKSGNELKIFEENKKHYEYFVTSLAYSPDGKNVILGLTDNTIQLWDVYSGKLLNTFEGHKHGIESVAYSPDGSNIISGSMDKTVKIWDIKKLKKLDERDYLDQEILNLERELGVKLEGIILNNNLY